MLNLALKGYRFDDLMRWNAGKLVEKEQEGIYFSGLGRHDLTGDGIPDIFQEPNFYYRPIPQNQVQLNNNLKQIFGW